MLFVRCADDYRKDRVKAQGKAGQMGHRLLVWRWLLGSVKVRSMSLLAKKIKSVSQGRERLAYVNVKKPSSRINGTISIF